MRRFTTNATIFLQVVTSRDTNESDKDSSTDTSESGKQQRFACPPLDFGSCFEIVATFLHFLLYLKRIFKTPFRELSILYVFKKETGLYFASRFPF